MTMREETKNKDKSATETQSQPKGTRESTYLNFEGDPNRYSDDTQ